MKTLIAIAAALTLSACSITEPTPAPAPVLSAPEAEAWRDVVACYDAEGYDTSRTAPPEVRVRDDCRSKWAAQDFYSTSYGDWVYGQAWPWYAYVEVCPDLKALRHEFSHVALWQLTGDSGEHVAGGCFDVR